MFPGIRPKRPLSSMALNMLLRRMNVAVTPHGFRTSFKVWCSDVAHAEFEVAEQCLSHRVGSAVSRAYNRTSMLERRRPIMTAWGELRHRLRRRQRGAAPRQGDRRHLMSIRLVAWLGVIAAALVQGATTLDAETLTCSTWQRISTCTSPGGYVAEVKAWICWKHGVWDDLASGVIEV